MEILYADATLLVASKPPRVLSTDEPGGMPDLLRQALGDPAANVRTVHRLDQGRRRRDGLRPDEAGGPGAFGPDHGWGIRETLSCHRPRRAYAACRADGG